MRQDASPGEVFESQLSKAEIYFIYLFQRLFISLWGDDPSSSDDHVWEVDTPVPNSQGFALDLAPSLAKVGAWGMVLVTNFSSYFYSTPGWLMKQREKVWVLWSWDSDTGRWAAQLWESLCSGRLGHKHKSLILASETGTEVELRASSCLVYAQLNFISSEVDAALLVVASSGLVDPSRSINPK